MSPWRFVALAAGFLLAVGGCAAEQREAKGTVVESNEGAGSAHIDGADAGDVDGAGGYVDADDDGEQSDEGSESYEACAPSTVQLNDANFDEETREGLWLVAVVTPWCNTCRAMCETLEATAQLAQHSRVLNGTAKVKGGADPHPFATYVGVVDASESGALSQRLEAASYPSLYFIDPDSEGGAAVPYDGARDLDSILTFLERMASAAVAPAEEVEFDAGPRDASFPLQPAAPIADGKDGGKATVVAVDYGPHFVDLPLAIEVEGSPAQAGPEAHSFAPHRARRRGGAEAGEKSAVAGARPLARGDSIYGPELVSWFVMVSPGAGDDAGDAESDFADAFEHAAKARVPKGRTAFIAVDARAVTGAGTANAVFWDPVLRRPCGGGGLRESGSESSGDAPFSGGGGVPGYPVCSPHVHAAASKRRPFVLAFPGNMALPLDAIPRTGASPSIASAVEAFVAHHETPIFGPLTPGVFDRYASSPCEALVICARDPDTPRDSYVPLFDAVRRAVTGVGNRGRGSRRDASARCISAGHVDAVRWSHFVSHYGISTQHLPECVSASRDGTFYTVGPSPSAAGAKLVAEVSAWIDAVAEGSSSSLVKETPGSPRQGSHGTATRLSSSASDPEGSLAQVTDWAARHAATLAMAVVAIAAYFAGARSAQ